MDVNGSRAMIAPGEDELAFREQQLSDTLMSPFCPGRTLVACPSEEATTLRGEIRGMLKDGKSQEEIQTILLRRYGEDIRGMPTMEGVGALAYITPCVFVLLALAVVTAILRRSIARTQEGLQGETGAGAAAQNAGEILRKT